MSSSLIKAWLMFIIGHAAFFALVAAVSVAA
jgi:hypothetical protein